jgi:hypothetical protein
MKPGTRIGSILIIAVAVALVALIAGCSASPTASASASAPAPASASAPASAPVTAPTLNVLAPTANAVIKGADVEVRIETTGLKFVDPSTTRVAGQGHVHFTLDRQPVTMSITPDYTFKGLAPGPHTLRIELVQNDTTPFTPATVETVTFTVK